MELSINMPDSGWSGLEGTPTSIDAFFRLPSLSRPSLSNDEPSMSPSEPSSVSTPSLSFHLCLQSHTPIFRLFLGPFLPQTVTESSATTIQAAQAMQVDSVDPVGQAGQAVSDTTPIDPSLMQLCRFAEINPGIMHRISSSPALADVTQLGEFLVDKEVATQVVDDWKREELFWKTASSVYPPCVFHFHRC